MRALRFLPLTMLVTLGVAPAAEARHGGDHDYGEGRVQVKTVARGLDSPRHLAFGDRGELFVAEAGRGSGGTTCMPGQRRRPGLLRRHRGGDEDRSPRPPVPDRVRARLAGEHRPRRAGRQQRASARTASSSPGDDKRPDHQRRPDRARRRAPRRRTPLTREALADINPVAEPLRQGPEITHRGRTVPLADIWDYERDFNPDAAVGQPRRSTPTPVDLLEDGNRLVVADAGGNALDTVDQYGRVKNLTLFENGPACQPPFRGPADPAAGRAHVRREGARRLLLREPAHRLPVPGRRREHLPRQSDARARQTVFASGFTNLMDLAFGRDGTLYALEIDHDSLLDPRRRGRAVRGLAQRRASARSRCPPARCRSRAGIAIDDGDFYVSINAGSPGGGKVVRIHLPRPR